MVDRKMKAHESESTWKQMRPRKQEETVKDMGRQLRAGAQPHTNIMTDVGRMVGAAAAEAEVRKKCGSGRSGSQRACRKESLSAAEVALGAEGAARGSLSERRKCGSMEVVAEVNGRVGKKASALRRWH